MNMLQEKFDRKYYGNYRAQIVKVNEDIKNGVYKVRVYPMMVDIEDNYLPYAMSNLTNKKNHDNLNIGDWVWVFFENNGNPHYPIIWSRCNVKDQIPSGCIGDEPNYYNDFVANSDIDESEIEYNGEYGKVLSKLFGDNIIVEIDEENEQIVLKGTNFYYVIDSNGDLHYNLKNYYTTSEGSFNIAANDMKLVIGDNTIEVNEEGFIVNDNLKVLNT